MIATATQWFRVNKEAPCRVCKKPDWCTWTEDGAACCMRVKSDRPMKNGGWLHKLKDEAPVYHAPVKAAAQPELDAQGLLSFWRKELKGTQLVGMAGKLGVDPISLYLLGIAWADVHQAWAFPMKDDAGKTIGIRLRNDEGKKWAVRGSRQGLFIPEKLTPQSQLFIVEGPTDCAAALTLGFYAVGRPSCLGCEEFCNQFIKRNKIRNVVIVADNDGPGMRGAERLQQSLKVTSCLWIPPTKDLREYIQQGGDGLTIQSAIRNLIWNQP